MDKSITSFVLDDGKLVLAFQRSSKRADEKLSSRFMLQDMKIKIEIEEIENGFLLYSSYKDNLEFFKRFGPAANKATLVMDEFAKNELAEHQK